MSLQLNYGLSDVRFLDYEVLLRLHDDKNRPLIPIGQCVADTIQDEYVPENQIRLNRGSDIVTSSIGTISFEIAHILTKNIKILRSLDKHRFDICLESIASNDEGFKRFTTIRNVLFNYEQEFAGGVVNLLPVSFSKKVSSPKDFSNISEEVPIDHVYNTTTGLNVTDIEPGEGLLAVIFLEWYLPVNYQDRDKQELWIRTEKEGVIDKWRKKKNIASGSTETSVIIDFSEYSKVQIAVRAKRDGELLRYSNIVTVFEDPYKEDDYA